MGQSNQGSLQILMYCQTLPSIQVYDIARDTMQACSQPDPATCGVLDRMCITYQIVLEESNR